MKTKHYYTYLDKDLCVCDDCGAHADKPKNVKHYNGCIPGEAKQWERYYAEDNDYERNKYARNIKTSKI